VSIAGGLQDQLRLLLLLVLLVLPQHMLLRLVTKGALHGRRVSTPQLLLRARRRLLQFLLFLL
jgi:hypothetical protein